MGPDARRSLATALIVLASLLLLAATLAGYARRALLRLRAVRRPRHGHAARLQRADADRRARDRSGRAAPAARTCWPRGRSSRRRSPAWWAARAFGSLFHRAALDAHRAVFEHDQNTVDADRRRHRHGRGGGAPVAAAGARARTSRTAGASTVVDRDVGAAAGTAARIARDVRVVAYLLAGLTLVAAVAALVGGARPPPHGARSWGWAWPRSASSSSSPTRSPAPRARQLPRPGRARRGGRRVGRLPRRPAHVGWVLVGRAPWSPPRRRRSSARWRSRARCAAAGGSATTEPARPWLRVAARRRARRRRRRSCIVAAADGGAGRRDARRASTSSTRASRRCCGSSTARPIPTAERRRPRRGAGVRAARGGSRCPRSRRVLVAGVVAAFLAGGGAERRRRPRSRAATATRRCATARWTRSCSRRRTTRCRRRCRAGSPSEQERSIGGQLQDGIRGLLLDTHYADKLAQRPRAHVLRAAKRTSTSSRTRTA